MFFFFVSLELIFFFAYYKAPNNLPENLVSVTFQILYSQMTCVAGISTHAVVMPDAAVSHRTGFDGRPQTSSSSPVRPVCRVWPNTVYLRQASLVSHGWRFAKPSRRLSLFARSNTFRFCIYLKSWKLEISHRHQNSERHLGCVQRPRSLCVCILARKVPRFGVRGALYLCVYKE